MSNSITCRTESTHTPYVVACDIMLLLQCWAERNRFSLPPSGFFTSLRSEFEAHMNTIFDRFELVPEQILVDGITSLVNSSGLHPISLDRVYFHSEPSLDITRLVDEEGRDKGVGTRANQPNLISQFRRLREIGIKEAVLVDDMIFSGNLLRRVCTILKRANIKISVICAGIGVSEGVRQLSRFTKEIRCVRQYEYVVDEVCERDFYLGVPLSGRSLIGMTNTGVPYVLPVGNPQCWASIPENAAQTMSSFCIKQSIKLFQAIEETTGRKVRCCDLDRNVYSLPVDQTRFIDALDVLLS